MVNVEPQPWLTLDLRLSEVEVVEIALRGAVTGKVACRILEAIASECDEYVRFLQGAMMPKRKPRRRAS